MTWNSGHGRIPFCCVFCNAVAESSQDGYFLYSHFILVIP